MWYGKSPRILSNRVNKRKKTEKSNTSGVKNVEAIYDMISIQPNTHYIYIDYTWPFTKKHFAVLENSQLFRMIELGALTTLCFN